MNNNYFLKSKRIYLRQIEMEDVPLLTKWVNDEIVTFFMFTGQKPQNSDQVAIMLKEELEARNNVIFLAMDVKTKKPIGYTGLYDIHYTARRAEYRALIGEKNFWGKGYGTELAEMIIYYGFDRLNLNRIYAGYTAENKSAARANEKAGFIYEGTLKEDIYRNSRYYDSIKVAILRKDYYQKFYKLHSKRFKQIFIK